MKLLSKINTHFESRIYPEGCCFGTIDSSEIEGLNAFCSRKWMEVDGELLERYFEAIYFLKPEAFLYFLPGIIKATLEEQSPDLLAAQGLVSMLDRSPDSKTWDSFFLARWPLLSKNECEVIEDWLFWLHENASDLYSDQSIERCLETIHLCKKLSQV